MVSWYEIAGERSDPKEVGRVRINTFYETRKKPVWLVLLKLIAVAILVAIGFYFLLPLSPLPGWPSAAIIAGVILIYVGLAFFVRPEPNGDNMGWLGGFMNDPTHYSDNLNRALWNVHCLLGPGRFIAEAILDCSTLVGLTAELTAEQANQEQWEQDQADISRDVQRWRQQALQRIEERQEERPGGQVSLSSAQYLDPDRFE